MREKICSLTREEYVAQISLQHTEAAEQGEELDLDRFDLTPEERQEILDATEGQLLVNCIRQRNPSQFHKIVRAVMLQLFVKRRGL